MPSSAPAAAPAAAGTAPGGITNFGGPSPSQEAAAQSAAGLSSAQKTAVSQGVQIAPSPGTPANSPLLTTSSQSRSTTSANIATFTGATTPQPTVTPTTQGSDTAAEDNTNPNSKTNSSTSSSTPKTPASDAGLPPGYSYTLPPAGSPYTTIATAQGPAYSSQGLATTTPQQLRQQGGTYVGSDGNNYYNYDSTPAPSAIPAGGGQSTPTGAPDTSGTTGDSSDVAATVAAGGIPTTDQLASLGIPPSLQGLYVSNLQNQQTEQQYALTVLQQAAALKANDPAIAQATASIQASYQTLIDAQNKKNAQILGRASASVGAFGGLGVMSQSFMGDEVSNASETIADLTTKMNTAVLNSQSAIEKEDITSFNDAMTQFKDSNTAMTTAIQNLMTAAKDQADETREQQTADLQAQNDQVAQDHTISTGLAQTIATIIGSGDPSTYDYASAAKTHGISDPAVLQSAVLNQIQTNSKDAATAAATAATANREDATLSLAQQRLAFDENNAANPKSTAADTSTANSVNNILDGASSLTDLVSSTGTLDPNYQNVKAQLVQKGFYNATYPAWFKTAINSGSLQIGSDGTPNQNENGAPQDTLPSAIQTQWTAYKNKVLGLDNSN